MYCSVRGAYQMAMIRESGASNLIEVGQMAKQVRICQYCIAFVKVTPGHASVNYVRVATVVLPAGSLQGFVNSTYTVYDTYFRW
jgi:hypothetical protein